MVRIGKVLHISEILEIYYPQFKRNRGKNESLRGLKVKNKAMHIKGCLNGN